MSWLENGLNQTSRLGLRLLVIPISQRSKIPDDRTDRQEQAPRPESRVHLRFGAQPLAPLSLWSRASLLTMLTLTMIAPVSAIFATSASATASDCHSYITSTGRPGGSMSGICYGGGGWYEEIGLCQNIFTWSSRWSYGNWVNGGVSYAGCSWYEKPVGGYVHLGS